MIGLHRDSHNDICRIPEADITSIAAVGRRVPRHNDHICIHSNIEDDDDIPCAERRTREAETLTSESNEVYANCEGEIEQ